MKQIKLSLLVAALTVTVVGWAEQGRSAISDVRIAPMLTTHWNQKTSTGYSNTGVPCYNYYTPNGYNVGCSATAMAQLMNYWRYPVEAPSVRHACQVDYRSTSLKTLGGVYDWANMVDNPAEGVTEDQCRAIGHLTYDCAVSLRSMFTTGFTTAYVAFAFDPLLSDFGYANAIGYMGTISGESIFVDPEEIRPTVLASLDYGAPVLMSILTESGIIHTTVVDGYGFEGGKLFVHLNFGLSNLLGEDAWYPLFDATRDQWHFTIIDGIVYNIFPKATGDVLSGRVTWKDGTPAVGVTVKAICGKDVETVQTGANGIYAFLLSGDKKYTVSVGRVAKSVQLPKSVSADCNFEESVPSFTKPGTLGNSWGNDFSIAAEDLVEPVPPVEDPLGGFNPKKAVSGAFPFCGVVRDAFENPVGTITLKVGKASKKGDATVSATITMLEGKKFSMKSTKFRVTEDVPSTVTGIVVKNFGTIELTVGEKGFAAKIVRSNGDQQVAGTADLTAGLANAQCCFHVDGLPETIDGKPVLDLAGCTPEGEPVVVTRGKWTLRKAGTPKFKRIRVKDASGKYVYEYVLTGLDDPKKPNCSGLKLTYTAKTGTFKGSFNLYCLAGTEAKPTLKKYSVSFSGLVIDGVAFGFAPAKKSVPSMSITIE